MPQRGPAGVLAITIALICFDPFAFCQAADPPASADEVHQLFEDEKYKEALQKLTRIAALKGDAAKAYDRYDILMLKGETHLRLKDATLAASTFALAAKDAPDDKSAAVARATELLVKRSKNLSYTAKPVKGKASGPIDISDPAKREPAFAAMLAEEKSAAAPKIRAAKAARTLPPIADGLKAAAGLRTLELAATGGDDEAKQIEEDLANEAGELMAKGVKKMDDLVRDIERLASELIEVRVPAQRNGGNNRVERAYKKRGLTTKDTRDLKGVIADCRKLVPSANDLAETAGAKQFSDVAEQAEEVGTRALEVLNADYSSEQDMRRRR